MLSNYYFFVYGLLNCFDAHYYINVCFGTSVFGYDYDQVINYTAFHYISS